MTERGVNSWVGYGYDKDNNCRAIQLDCNGVTTNRARKDNSSMKEIWY